MAKFRGNPSSGANRQGAAAFRPRPFVENEQLTFLMCDLILLMRSVVSFDERKINYLRKLAVMGTGSALS
jgi:hypothetical protein